MKILDYAEACLRASDEQGITAIVQALSDLGIKAESAQTGGFTMCAYVELTSSRYIYANRYGASIYTDEDYLSDIVQAEVALHPRTIAKAIYNYINN